MDCANCKSSDTVLSKSGKMLFCCACEESIEIKEKVEQHAGGEFGQELLGRIDRLTGEVQGLRDRMDGPRSSSAGDPDLDPPGRAGDADPRGDGDGGRREDVEYFGKG